MITLNVHDILVWLTLIVFGSMIFFLIVVMPLEQWHAQRMCDSWNDGYDHGREDEKTGALGIEKVMR